MNEMNFKNLIIHALASNQKIPLPPIKSEEWDLSLLNYLRKNGIPVAFSCNGEGVCLKCVVNQTWVSCQLPLKHLFEQVQEPTVHLQGESLVISISYL